MPQSASNEHVLDDVAPPPVDELADVVAERVTIERATGMLVLVYDLDADNALELLKWGSHARDMDLGPFAHRLAEGLAAGHEPADLRVACDDLLFGLPSGREIQLS